VATRVSRVPVTGRFADDGTPGSAPRAPAGATAATAGDAYGRPACGRDDSPLRGPLLGFARPWDRARRRGPRSCRGARPREVAARVHRRGGGGEPLVRACDRSRRRRADPRQAARGSHRDRNDHAGARDRAARLLRHRRIAPGRRLARIRRRGRPGAHARAAPLVPPRLRTRARGSRARDRLSRNARARRAADGVRPLLHPPVRRYRGAARVGVPLRPRDLPAALPRRRAPLFRPAGPCRLVAPTEEDRCRRTSCCPT